MTLVSFGDLAQTNLLNRNTTQTKLEIARLSTELSTGRSSDTPRHLSGDMGPILAIDSSLARLSGYNSISRELGLFASAMQTSLTTIADIARSAGNSLIAASGTAATTHIDTAVSASRSALEAAVSALNTRFGDRTLFAGTLSNEQAVASTAVLVAAVQTATSGATDVAGVETAIDAWFAAPGGFASTFYRGGSPLSAVPIAAGESVALDITANDPAVRDTLKGLVMAAMLDQGAFSGQIGLRKSIAQRAGEHLLASETDRAHLAARLGGIQAQIDNASTRNSAEQTTLRITRAGLTEIDSYETTTQLQNAETQLQLMYTITARISRLSLADYL